MQIADYLLLRTSECAFFRPLRGLDLLYSPHSPGLRPGLPSCARFAGFGMTVKIYDPLH